MKLKQDFLQYLQFKNIFNNFHKYSQVKEVFFKFRIATHNRHFTVQYFYGAVKLQQILSRYIDMNGAIT